MSSRYKTLKAMGLCTRCGKVKSSSTHCPSCAEKIAIANKKYYSKTKEGRNTYNKKYYEENKETILSNSKKYYENNKFDRCGKQIEYYEENADVIKKKVKTIYHERKAKGLCVQCSEPSDGKARCKKCRDLTNERNKENRKQIKEHDRRTKNVKK